MWLPLLNFLVICATLVYQAPLQLLLPGQRTGKVRFVGALNSSRSLPLGCSNRAAVLCVMLPHATLHCWARYPSRSLLPLSCAGVLDCTHHRPLSAGL